MAHGSDLGRKCGGGSSASVKGGRFARDIDFFLQGTDRQLQETAVRRVHRHPAEERLRKGSEAGTERANRLRRPQGLAFELNSHRILLFLNPSNRRETSIRFIPRIEPRSRRGFGVGSKAPPFALRGERRTRRGERCAQAPLPSPARRWIEADRRRAGSGPLEDNPGHSLFLLATTIVAPLLGLPWVIGFVVSGAAMLGDVLSSFIKRRLKLSASSQAVGIDQLPESSPSAPGVRTAPGAQSRRYRNCRLRFCDL